MYRDLITLRRNQSGVMRGLCGQNIHIYHFNDEAKFMAFHRWDKQGPADSVVVVVNMTNQNRDGYHIGFSIKDYKKKIKTPQVFFMPAIDPFSILNRDMSEKEVKERLDHYNIPTDLPLVVQVSRFDRWKDPEGVIQAFRIARKEIDATLVLLGNVATDAPEGAEVYKSLLDCREERIIILSHQDTALVNALQRKPVVVLQKSIREGFGLTVAEAMWKGTPVIGGNVGGIRYQIKNGVNGFLVSSIEEAAKRMVQLVKDKTLRKQIGEKAKETVRRKFLLTRYLEQYLDLFNSFETVYRLRPKK
jgi:trehalose synthase